MAESLGKVMRASDDEPRKEVKLDTPEARAARIALYAERASNNQCIFTGEQRGKFVPTIDDDDEE